MFQTTSTQDIPHARFSHDRRPSHTIVHSEPFRYGVRSPVELPRPMEPRAMSHLMNNETQNARPDVPSHFNKPNGHSLPGLKDILSGESQLGGTPSHINRWISTSAAQDVAPRGYGLNGNGWTSSIPSLEPLQTQPSLPERHRDLPIHERSPTSRKHSNAVPMSPFNGAPVDSRNPADIRHGRLSQASTGSYHTNGGAPSPYPSSGTDDVQYTSPATTLGHYGNGSSPAGSLPDRRFVRAPVEVGRKFLRTVEVPGEGHFHLYDDGSRCPVEVDGDPVKPEWGLTKANKARKRKPFACLDCREKKIKCEAGTNMCLPCEKAKRTCRIAPSQSHQSNESVSNASWTYSMETPVRGNMSFPTPNGGRTSEIYHPRQTEGSTSPPSTTMKRYRSGSPVAPPRENSTYSTDTIQSNGRPHGNSLSNGTQRGLHVDNDPLCVDRDMTMYMLDMYLLHVNNTTYCMFPAHTLMQWTTTSATKTESEKMTLYAMLALGSIFTGKETTRYQPRRSLEEFERFGERCCQIAEAAVVARAGKLTLPDTQTRLVLGLYHYSKGSNNAAWDHLGAAVRACTSRSLRFNTETGCVEDTEEDNRGGFEFSLTADQLAECRRRTFWSCFIMDRYLDDTRCSMSLEDAFVRLPCADEMYERGTRSEAPYFDNRIIDPLSTILTPSSPVSPMAWLILVASVWGDVINFVYRSSHRSDSNYPANYETFYGDTYSALQGWISRLPEYLQYNKTNVDRSIQGGYAGCFISMHALYHFALMKLNRYIRHRLMRKVVSRNIRAAHQHANAVLGMMSVLHTASREANNTSGPGRDFVFSAPFLGRITMFAIDIVGAGGLEASLKPSIDTIEGGLEVLRELGQYWASAGKQHQTSLTRYYQIRNILSHPYKARSGCWIGDEWGTAEPLEHEFSLDMDCIYGIIEAEGKPNSVYFDSLKEAPKDAKRHVHASR